MNWYCLHTKPRRETQIAEQLELQYGLETFFPQVSREKLYRRKVRQFVEPLFPRYLFCRLNVATHFGAVRYAHDVLDIVSLGAAPTIVSDGLVDELKSWSASGTIIPGRPMFEIGDHVEITDGPMRGLQAVILDNRSQGERVAVLLSILGSEAHLSISRAQLAKAG